MAVDPGAVQFLKQHHEVLHVAAAIRSTATAASEAAHAPEAPDDDEDEAAEGKLLTRQHRQRERSSKLVKRKKAKVLKATGNLACEACGFDFQATYGEPGAGFAECHHTKPLSTLRPGERTRLTDLSIVCANCHRMLHRGARWLTVSELAALVVRAREG